MNWIQKLWPRRTKAKSKPGLGGALVPSYGQDLQDPDELINRANKRAVKGDLDGAIADFDAAIELNPAKATSFYNRGYLNNLAGNHDQALQDCTEAIALLPDYDEAFYQRGVAQQSLGHTDAAVADFSEVLRLNPFSIKAYYKRASCYAIRDDIEGAVADYTQAILRVPKDPNAYLQRGIFLTKLQEYRTAVEDFSSALSLNPKNAEAYYHRGYCYAELGEKEKATQDFNQAMLYDPSQRVADYSRSYALGILKETKTLPPATATTVPPEQPTVIQGDDAVVLSLNLDEPTIFTTNVADLPQNRQTPNTGLDRQNASLDIGESREPLLELSIAPERAPTLEDSDADMGVSNAQSVASPSVSEDIDDLSPSTLASSDERSGELVRQSDIDVLFVEAQHQAQMKNFEAAIAIYSQIIELEPNNARAYLERGRSFNAINHSEDAALDSDTAVHLAKRKSLDLMKDYNNTLSEVLADLKGGLEWETHPSSQLVHSPGDNQSIEGAILKYSQLIHRNPLDVHAYFERAKSRALLGDLEGAIADYTRTISLDDKYRDAYYRRGMLLAALGDEDGATRDMNKAILRKPLLPAAAPSTSSTYVPMQWTQTEPSEDQAPVTTSQMTSEMNSVPIQTENVNPTTSSSHSPGGDELMNPDEPIPDEPIPDESIPDESIPEVIDAVEPSSPQEKNVHLATPVKSMADDLMADDVMADDGAVSVRGDQDEMEMRPSYFSDLVLEPCAHEGNDPAHRFCIHCGQAIDPTL